jgi:hypothetical protein
MSYSTLWAVYRTTATEIAEYGNSWLSAPPLWNFLWREYVNRNDTGYPVSEARMKPLWDLAADSRVPLDLRIAHAMTFDHAIVKARDFRKVEEALRAVYGILQRGGACPNSHWWAVGTAIGDLKGKLPKKAIGVGLGCTSVSDDWNHYREKHGRVDYRIWDAVEYAKSARNDEVPALP